MNKEELKIKLLTTEVFEDNEYLDQYCELIYQNLGLQYIKGQVQRHHINPQCYFKLNNLKVDNSKENLVNLFYKDHILAHYYLALCCKESLKMHLAFAFGKMCEQIGLKTKEEFDFTKLDYYQELYQLRCKATSLMKLGKSVGSFSEDHIEKIRKSKSGVKQSQKTRELKSNALKGKAFIKHSVYCIELDKIFLNLAKVKEALGFDPVEVHRVCEEKRRSIQSLTFRYIKNIDYIYCPELNEYFETLKDIQNKYGYAPSSISACITGKAFTYQKMHWKRVNMYELGIFSKEELLKDLTLSN